MCHTGFYGQTSEKNVQHYLNAFCAERIKGYDLIKKKNKWTKKKFKQEIFKISGLKSKYSDPLTCAVTREFNNFYVFFYTDFKG